VEEINCKIDTNNVIVSSSELDMVADLPRSKYWRFANLPSSLGMGPVNELPVKSKNAAQKKETDRKAKNERHTEIDLFVLLNAEPQGEDTQLIHSLNSDNNLPSSCGMGPLRPL
jgi:hypothetical protein